MPSIQTRRNMHQIDHARTLIPGGVNSASRLTSDGPFCITASEGSRLTDSGGREYIDYHGAFGAKLLGHNHPLVREAVSRAIHSVDLVGVGITPGEIEFAELVCQAIPSAEMVVATTSGSEAVAHAIRLARAYTGRRKILKFQGCFHGWYDTVARNVASAPERAYQYDPISSGMLPESLSPTVIAEFNDIEGVRRIFAEHGEEIAGLIIEPISHNVGTILPSPEFLRDLRAVTKRYGTVLIFDEVITGFRHALGGYQEIAKVEPDLTCFGKAVGNGYPIAGLAGRAPLLSEFSSSTGDVLLAATFSGHPIPAAAATATIKQLAGNDGAALYDLIYALGDRMRNGMNDILTSLSIPGVCTGYGSIFVTYFGIDRPPTGYRDLLRHDDRNFLRYRTEMTSRGHLILPIILKRAHISAAHNEEDVDSSLEAAYATLSAEQWTRV